MIEPGLRPDAETILVRGVDDLVRLIELHWIDADSFQIATLPMSIELSSFGSAFDPLDDDKPVGSIFMYFVSNLFGLTAPVGLLTITPSGRPVRFVFEICADDVWLLTKPICYRSFQVWEKIASGYVSSYHRP